MDVMQLLIDELTRETTRSRRALEHVPDDKRAWKPHDRSMEFGYLADMVATIPTWITMIITKDELDVAPKEGKTQGGPKPTTSKDYVKALDAASYDASRALSSTNLDHLGTNWKLLAGGKVMLDLTRLEMITDTINHWVHHRGQMTVYLRLMGATVPALYGPSADEARFD
jgi:uncharacterized damage-inducible protein DinB